MISTITENNTIYLRPLKITDAETSWRWRNDAEVWLYTGNRPDIVVDAASEKAWLAEKLQSTTDLRYAICINGTDEYIGNAQFTDITKHGAQLHLFIGARQHWGKGLGKQATAALLKIADEVLGCTVVFLLVHPDNVAAVSIYRSLGFQQVGNIEKNQVLMERRLVMPRPDVSVFVMTYNHESFAGMALESILAQQTNYSLEICIGDDCSSDNTRKIIYDSYKKYPQLFKLILHSSRQGAAMNQQVVMENCRGRYIAFLEGDDYWNCNDKIEKQVSFLEDHTEYALCLHHVDIEQTSGNHINLNRPDHTTSREISLVEICTANLFQAVSMVIRNYGHPILPVWSKELGIGDYPLQVLMALKGKIFYFSDSMAVYRLHDRGTWSAKKETYRLEKFLEILDCLLTEEVPVQARQALLQQRHINADRMLTLYAAELNDDFFSRLLLWSDKDAEIAKKYNKKLIDIYQDMVGSKTYKLIKSITGIRLKIRKIFK